MNIIEAYSRTISNRDRDMHLEQGPLLHWGINYVFWAPCDPPGDRKFGTRSR
jgi:hypothetical protein